MSEEIKSCDNKKCDFHTYGQCQLTKSGRKTYCPLEP